MLLCKCVLITLAMAMNFSLHKKDVSVADVKFWLLCTSSSPPYINMYLVFMLLPSASCLSICVRVSMGVVFTDSLPVHRIQWDLFSETEYCFHNCIFVTLEHALHICTGNWSSHNDSYTEKRKKTITPNVLQDKIEMLIVASV